MANYDPSINLDFYQILHDRRSPGVALERRTLSTASLTFSSSLVAGQPYYLMSWGSTTSSNVTHFTLNGQTPVLTDGTGSNLGIPTPDGVATLFIPDATQTTIKALTVAGSAVLTLWVATSGSRV